jgi:hypothetical protein
MQQKICKPRGKLPRQSGAGIVVGEGLFFLVFWFLIGHWPKLRILFSQ